jgi:Trypsin
MAWDADTLIDPLQDLENAVANVARMVVGDDDHAFVQLFQAVMNIADRSSMLLEANEQDLSRAISVAPQASQFRNHAQAVSSREGLAADPVVIKNTLRLIASNKRIIGGIPTSEFPDCVAIGGVESWCCNGTLVAHNLVVTAAHCKDEGCASRIFIGDDVNLPELGEEIWVEKVREFDSALRRL